MADFRDHVYDRMNVLGCQLSKATASANPSRSPSTKKNLVDDEVKPIICELIALMEILGRTP